MSDSVPAIAVTPAVILSMGRFGPMTPVEPSSTYSAGMFSAFAVCAAVCAHMSMPAAPVAALAMPALTTTAWAARTSRTILWSQTTGAALTTLVVKAPATAQGASL